MVEISVEINSSSHIGPCPIFRHPKNPARNQEVVHAAMHNIINHPKKWNGLGYPQTNEVLKRSSWYLLTQADSRQPGKSAINHFEVTQRAGRYLSKPENHGKSVRKSLTPMFLCIYIYIIYIYNANKPFQGDLQLPSLPRPSETWPKKTATGNRPCLRSESFFFRRGDGQLLLNWKQIETSGAIWNRLKNVIYC